MLRILATMDPSTAVSMSASSKTSTGALPPSSIAGVTTQSAAERNNLRPTSVEPVKLMTRTRGSCSRWSISAPDFFDGSTLTTPFGTPASSNNGISSSMVSGVAEAGLMMTGQPAASAGAILRVPMAAGKVPGRHERRDAGGLALDDDPCAGGGGTDDEPIGAHRFFRKPSEELGRVDRLTHRVGSGFAVFERDQTGDVRQPRGHQVEDLAQRLRVAGAASGSPNPQRRPARRRARRRRRRSPPRRRRRTSPPWRG